MDNQVENDQLEKHSVTFVAIDYGTNYYPPLHSNPDDPNFDEDDSGRFVVCGSEPYEYYNPFDEEEIATLEEQGYDIYPEEYAMNHYKMVSEKITEYSEKRKAVINQLAEKELLKFEPERYYYNCLTAPLPSDKTFGDTLTHLMDDRSKLRKAAHIPRPKVKQSELSTLFDKEKGEDVSAITVWRWISDDEPYYPNTDQLIKLSIYLRLDSKECMSLFRKDREANLVDDFIEDIIFREMVNCGSFCVHDKIPNMNIYNGLLRQFVAYTVSAYFADKAEHDRKREKQKQNGQVLQGDYRRNYKSFYNRGTFACLTDLELNELQMHPMCRVIDIDSSNPEKGRCFCFIA